MILLCPGAMKKALTGVREVKWQANKTHDAVSDGPSLRLIAKRFAWWRCWLFFFLFLSLFFPLRTFVRVRGETLSSRLDQRVSNLRLKIFILRYSNWRWNVLIGRRPNFRKFSWQERISRQKIRVSSTVNSFDHMEWCRYAVDFLVYFFLTVLYLTPNFL